MFQSKIRKHAPTSSQCRGESVPFYHWRKARLAEYPLARQFFMKIIVREEVISTVLILKKQLEKTSS
jgi:hypothetical protein